MISVMKTVIISSVLQWLTRFILMYYPARMIRGEGRGIPPVGEHMKRIFYLMLLNCRKRVNLN